MSDGIKTLTYTGIALACALVAYVWRPAEVPTGVPTAVNTVLFPDFDNAQKAKSIEINTYDEALTESRKLLVEQQKDGSWTIPTHDNYPADAEIQLRDAATLLFDLRSLGVASELSDEYEMYGVKSPDKDQLKPGDRGVGLQVRLRDEKGDVLASLIIGNKVKGADDQRFVRIPNQAPVYVAKIDPAKLSTKFSDWIEKDLLNLNAFDVNRIRLRDYSVGRSESGGFVQSPRLDAEVTFDSTSNQWALSTMQTFLRDKAVATQLAENEELNKEKLDAMKTALDELQIVDVHPKPKGLRADLKADAGFLNDTEGVQSLVTRGFYPLRSRNSPDAELYSANGEVHIAVKDGSEYVLRFGNIAGAEEGSTEGKLNRFLFVLARVDEAQFTPPALEPETADVPTTDAKPDPPAEKPADKPTAKPCSDDEPAAKSADDKPAADKPDDKPIAKSDDKPEAKPADAPEAKPAAKPAEKKPDPAAERERIKKDNQRKLDEFKERRKKAENRVAELNARFADWYYVIPEDTYKKIHLGRVDLIREKSAASDEGTGIDSFRKLQKEGVDPPPPPPPAGGPPGGFPPGLGLPPG